MYYQKSNAVKNKNLALLGTSCTVAIIAFILGIIFESPRATAIAKQASTWVERNYHCTEADVTGYLLYKVNAYKPRNPLETICYSGFEAFQEYEKENPKPTPTPLRSFVYPTTTSAPTTYYTCKHSGNGLSCDNGTVIENNGGQLRSEHGGTIYREIGNQIVGSDGSICEPSGGGQYTCSN